MVVRVGTSGFQYKSWHGRFYPADVPQKRWLEYYSRHFDTVEVNNSFYRLPSAKTFADWRQRTPDGFCFAIKGSRYITHRLRLNDPEPHIRLLFDRADALGRKLGVTLWQLPANLRFDTDRAEQFCSALPSKVRQAIEPRHDSWFRDEAYGILRQHNVALVIAHSAKWPYRDDVVTADFIYARFHGAPDLYASSYSASQLRYWANKLKKLADGRDIFAYFNNDANAYAPSNAKQLQKLLDPSRSRL